MDATVWQSADLSHRYLTGVRGALPLAAAQIDTLLRLVSGADIPVRRILDLGCGDGILALALLERFPGATTVGIDFSEPMLEAARDRSRDRADAVRWVRADYADSTWTLAAGEPGSFDVIVSGFSVHHQPDELKRPIYGDCFRLLAPGGVFLNLEHVASGSEWAARVSDTNLIDHLHAHAVAGGDPRSREEIATEFHHRPDKAANRLSPVDEQCHWLRALGFVEVDCFFRQFELALFGGRRPGATRESPAASLPSGIRIVPTAEDHIDRLWAAVDSVARERRFLMAVEAFPLEASRHFVKGNLLRGHPQVVALSGDDVVGWCDIVPANPFPGFGHGGRLGMGVVAGWRGKGIGRALIDAALKAAPCAGFRRVELDVFSTNTAAIGLYRRIGFVQEGIKRDFRDLDGIQDDLIQYAWYPPAT